MPNEFFTLQMLSSIAGIVIAVVLVVQMFKGLVDNIFSFVAKKIFKINNYTLPTKYLTVIVSEVLFFLAQYYTIKLDGATIFLTFLNGLVISAAAMKSFDSLSNKDKINETK